MKDIFIILDKVSWILRYIVLKLFMVVGLSNTQGLTCGRSCLWILKGFQIWLVLVRSWLLGKLF